MPKRLSEQVDWDDRRIRSLRACVAGGMLQKTMAQRFGVTEREIARAIDEGGAIERLEQTRAL